MVVSTLSLTDAIYSHFWQTARCCTNRYEEPFGMWAENYGKFTSLILRLLEIGSYRVFLLVSPAVTLYRKDSYKSADNSIKWQNFFMPAEHYAHAA